MNKSKTSLTTSNTTTGTDAVMVTGGAVCSDICHYEIRVRWQLTQC